MRVFLLALALATAGSLAAEDKIREWSVSTEVLSLSPGWGITRRGLGFEHITWDHIGLVGVGNLNLRGYGFSHSSVGTGLDVDFKLGGRYRPEARGLKGFYAGMGLEKGLFASYLWSTDLNVASGYGFSLWQYLSLYGELGWQWVRTSGLLSGIKVTVPLYADWYLGAGSLQAEMTTLSWDLGYAW